MLLNMLALLGCPQEAAAPEPVPAECTLTFDGLVGKTFIRQERAADGKDWKEDTWARMRFAKDGDKVKVKYNTRALVEMYDYTCAKGKGELLCLADGPDLQQWCQTLIANKGTCSPAELADLTGVPVDQAMKAHEDLMAKVNKMAPEELDKMKMVFANPNNQLRGVLHVKINKDECRITAQDTFQTMTEGKLREVENFVGTSRFVESDKDLVFETCKDHASLVALTAPDAKAGPGQTKLEWKVGETVPFKFVADKMAKVEAGCTYTMDTYVGYEPTQKGATVTPDAGGKLDWSFSTPFTEHGTKVVHMYRYKACGGAGPALQDVTCARVNVLQ